MRERERQRQREKGCLVPGAGGIICGDHGERHTGFALGSQRKHTHLCRPLRCLKKEEEEKNKERVTGRNGAEGERERERIQNEKSREWTNRSGGGCGRGGVRRCVFVLFCFTTHCLLRP
jgi:hypothetical protein